MSLDTGVAQVGANTLTLGDPLFKDVGNDGSFNGSDAGIAGVTVQLLNGSSVVIDSATTDASGIYQFTNLASSYRVRLPAENFQAGGATVGFTSSTGVNNAFEARTRPARTPISMATTMAPRLDPRPANWLHPDRRVITLVTTPEPINDGDPMLTQT